MILTNEQGLSRAWVIAAGKDNYDKVGDISVTDLLKPPRNRLLNERHDAVLEQDVTDCVWRLLGTAVHHILGLGNEGDCITEQRFTYHFEGTEISAKPDRLEPDPNRPGYWRLLDFKVSKTWAWIFNDKGDWEAQLQMYRYLVEKAQGLKISEIAVELLMKDWNDKDRIIALSRKDRYPRAQVAVMDYAIWNNDRVEAFLRERIAVHKAAEALPDTELPDCTEEERWAKKGVWKVFKKQPDGRLGKRSVRNFEAEEGARTFASGRPYTTDVQYHPAVSTRCEYYCPASKVCDQFQFRIKSRF
ncbi:MAG: hypothetical protein IH951_11670 [Bacteroidetes bacterium]|nr:hypothetical protein [Bacteroidota bacterium]